MSGDPGRKWLAESMGANQFERIVALRGMAERAGIRRRAQGAASGLIRLEGRGMSSSLRKQRKQRAGRLSFSYTGIRGRHKQSKQAAQCSVTSSIDFFTTSPSHSASLTVSDKGGINTTTLPSGLSKTPRLRAARQTWCPTRSA